ncbi:MAG: hypothetical protein ACLUR5_15285 [Eubacterium ventriosum]
MFAIVGEELGFVGVMQL